MARRPKRKPGTARRTGSTGTAVSGQRSAVSEKVRAHRERMHKRGFRLVQMWVPDTRTKEFAKLAHKASLAIANSPSDAEDQAFVDSASWRNSKEAAELAKREPDTPWWREPSDT